MTTPIKQRLAKTPLQFLIAMRWILDKIGWTKLQTFVLNTEGEKTAFCLSGAAQEVLTPGIKVYFKNWSLIRAHVIETRGVTPVAWNDDELRTKQDVLDLLDEMIAQERKKAKKK